MFPRKIKYYTHYACVPNNFLTFQMGAKEKQFSSLDFVRIQKQQTKRDVLFPRKQFEQQSIMGRELKGNTCPVMLLLKGTLVFL